MDKIIWVILGIVGAGGLYYIYATFKGKPKKEEASSLPPKKDLAPEEKAEIRKYFEDFYAYKLSDILRRNLGLFIHLGYENKQKLKERFPEKDLPELFMGKFWPAEATTNFLRELAREYGVNPGDENRQPYIEEMIKKHLEKKAAQEVLAELEKYITSDHDKKNLEELKQEYLS